MEGKKGCWRSLEAIGACYSFQAYINEASTNSPHAGTTRAFILMFYQPWPFSSYIKNLSPPN